MGFIEEIEKEAQLQNDLLLNITRYLVLKNNDFDKEIAQNLTLVKLTIGYDTDDWENPIYFVVLHVPLNKRDFYTSKVIKRIEDVICHIYPKDDERYFNDVRITTILETSYEGWQEKAFKYLAGEEINNQASFKSSKFPMLEHNGLNFRSKAEVEIAKAFEKRSDCLVFPLPIGLSGKIRKEPDFLVCINGKWGILEIISDFSHQSSTADANRTRWFQNHLVHIQEYDERDCRLNPDKIVDKFLKWLSRL